jgi:hypothetical protein
MNPLAIGAVLLGGAYLLTRNTAPTAASEVPADANSLLAIVLAPSMTNLEQLVSFYNQFAAATANATTPQATLRLSLYAIVTALKIIMLRSGAQPDADELLAIAYAPSSGMGGIQQRPDAPADAQQSVLAGLTGSSVDTMQAYLIAIETAAIKNAQISDAQRKRLLTYALAIKVKQLLTQAGMAFPNDTPYYAIANMPPRTIYPQNSLLRIGANAITLAA